MLKKLNDNSTYSKAHILKTTLLFNCNKQEYLLTIFKMIYDVLTNNCECCCSVTQSCPIFCDPRDCSSTPGFPVLQPLLELSQTHVYWVSDASNHLILCHPLSSCPQSFTASGSFLMSQFFASEAKVLEFQLKHQSFQWIFRTDFL